MKKSQNSIPVGKVNRASRFVRTGIQVGGNYVKHYAKRLVDPSTTRDELHNDNAEDIYNSLSELKGSALKVAQMMSMDKNMLPRAYAEKFQLSQYSAPPLSGPLVVKTFREAFGKAPQAMFDRFNMEAMNAASIGQVHEAWKDGTRFAVKIQYPGVANSISSDLKMVRPFAIRLLNLNEKEVDKYMAEVEEKLIEETDYELELRRGQEIAQACGHLHDLDFPTYYPEFSSRRILTMDWMEGLHLDDFLKTHPSQETRNRLGQALWDFYEYQIHTLQQVHADPHPGNFLMRANGTLGVIDFGCVKVLPPQFYRNYFALLYKNTLGDQERLDRILYELEFFTPQDTEKEKDFFRDIFLTMIELLGRPFSQPTFDFSNDAYFEEIYALSEKLSAMPEIRESKVARGVKDTLYVNRTYFGLYSILNLLGATVHTEATPMKESA
ncbi:ABC1 family protein [Catalinimonas alkaloidigena]|uniref:ABC1 family protein n=1 Tax=Catalinimonas alkaloidigena TaxID=1075417 RepID=A0A1G9NBL3_9BACT|nr:AarF/ABC1/UbiB kinase family protein [Catalinimonas alkaloidigena]SDL83918.1 ABC1 family protein [Catalinimonas alkaloidigena]